MAKTNEAVKQAAELLERGVAEVFASGRFAEYLTVMGKFHNYSTRNCILIMMQCPNATHVASYKKWQSEFNRQVRKGEKSIRILAPIQRKATVTKKDAKTGEEVETEVKWLGYKAVPVFDVSQTEGEELPELATKLKGDVSGFSGLCDRIAKAATVPVEFGVDINGPENGYFDPYEGRICIREGLSEQQTVKTLVHETAHSILHGFDGEQHSASREVREVQAEGVAYVVCNVLGIDTSDYSFGYVAGWGGDTKELISNLDVIRTTANTILEQVAAA